MIERLPLLPPTWSEWNWDESNGTATKMQTNAARYAVERQGLCRDFSRYVWNDIVHLLDLTLKNAGFEWDSKYGTASDCLIAEMYGELTAKAFNAVVCNTNKLGIFRWNWERTNNLPGFLGRTYMKGYAECGKSADLLYGWYITELTQKLNHLIEVLKNTAAFSEFEPVVKGTAEICSSVAVPGAGAMDFAKEIDAEYLAAVAVAGVLAQYAQEKSLSKYRGMMNAARAKIMKATGKGMTFACASQEKIKAEAMKAAGKGSTISGSILSDMAFVGRMNYMQNIAANIDAKIEISNLSDVIAVHRGKSEDFAKLVSSKVWLMGTQVHGDSYEMTNLMKLVGTKMNAASVVNSNSWMEISLMDKVLMSGCEVEKSSQRSILHYVVPFYMKKDIYAVTIPKANANTVVSFPIQSDCRVDSYSESRNDICKSNPVEWAGKSETLENAIVRAMRVLKMTAAAGSVSAENGSKIIFCDAVRLDTYEKVKSKSQGMIQKGIPKIVDVVEKAQTADLSDLVSLHRRVCRTNETIYGICESEVQKKQAGALDVLACTEGTKTKCVLELECNEQGIWKDPIQNGNALYIRSVFPQWQEGGNVHIDSGGEFYEPIQTGGNVYIRSNESLKGW